MNTPDGDQAKDDSDDRRRDTRHSIPGTEIKVRKHSFAGLGRFENSLPVDFSENGMSFISAKLELEMLEKVDFILSLEGRQVEGTALICHKSVSEHGSQYGLLFIATNSDITNLVNPGVFANLEINMHAEKTAEYVAEMIGHSNNVVSNSKYWNLLANAVAAFVRRISDIVREKSETKEDYQRAITAIREFISIDRDKCVVSFRYLNIAGVIETADISVHSPGSLGEIEYRISDLKTTSSVQEVIDIIGRAFVDQYRAGFPETQAK
ncbi:MAG: hypothetical protein AB8B86_10715 [Pseudomonadales bacterium]